MPEEEIEERIKRLTAEFKAKHLAEMSKGPKSTIGGVREYASEFVNNIFSHWSEK